MSYAYQGDVDYSFQPGETLLEWNIRVRKEIQADLNKAAVDKKIAEAEEIAKRVNSSSAGSSPAYSTAPSSGATPRRRQGVDYESIAIVGGSLLFAIYLARNL